MPHLRRHLAATLLLSISALFSASAIFAAAPRMTRVDPPNWWVNMPKAMLLVQGEHLTGSNFRLGSADVAIDHVKTSTNGHWAELWLSAPIRRAGTILIEAVNADGKAVMPFVIGRRREPNSGFAGFSSKDVMYLIMTDRFADGDPSNDGPGARDQASSPAAIAERARPRGWHGGDLRGILDHLDYLQTLGITTVWTTPVYQNHEAGSYHGYGATDVYAVDEHYGTLDDYRALAAALHKRGMKLVMDTVPNHLGPAHPWVDDSPEPDWFHGTKAAHHEAQGDFLPLTNPHAPWRDRRDVTEGWFANILPDLNQENPAVAQYLMENNIWWIESVGLDALRIDTFPYVSREFWRDFHATLHSLYPNLTTVGEVFNGDATVTSAFAAGVTRIGVDTGLYTPFDFPVHFGIRNVFTGRAPMDRLAELLRGDSLYPHPERLVPFIDNHDTARFLSEPGASLERLKLAMAFLLTTRGMPQIYTGDEIAMRGGEDPDNRHDFPGGFNEPSAAGPSFPALTENSGQTEMLTVTRDLLHLRSSEPALQVGAEQILYSSADSLVYTRTLDRRRILVAIHLGEEDVQCHIPIGNTVLAGASTYTTLYGKGSFAAKGNEADVSLSANAVLIAALP